MSAALPVPLSDVVLISIVTFVLPCTQCTACKPTTVLPNGLEVCYASKYDVSFLYREIFEEQTYLQHGIKLSEGDVVVDIGGNIGFFTMFAAGLLGSTGKIITAEPIPTLYDKLTHNVRSHQTWSQQQGEYLHVVCTTNREPCSHMDGVCCTATAVQQDSLKL